MNCQQYARILNVFLDSEIESLPVAAQQHRSTCANCQKLTLELLTLRRHLGRQQAFRLPQATRKAMARQVMDRIRVCEKQEKMPFRVRIADIVARLRWRRVLATAAAAVVLVLALRQLQINMSSQNTAMIAEDEVETLLEEHRLQMESSLFHTNALSSQVVIATVVNSN